MAGSQSLTHIPAAPGSYVLHLILPEPVQLMIGRLGVFHFPARDYLYLGSAHGPGGLRGRLAHHFRPVVRPHWHVDYLRARAAIHQVWWVEGGDLLECAWSRALLRLPGAFVPAPGFGASDCHQGCASHLIGLAEEVEVEAFHAALRAEAGQLVLAGKIEYNGGTI